MLERLCIENYALIDHLDISFPGDLVIITGETGAGKSILLGALSLLLGTRADSAAISDKSRNCVIEAEFSGDGADVIVRRVINPSGRSRAFVDDEPVSLDELKEVTSRLVDIHSQHQHLLLSDRRFQLSALDGYSGLSDDVREYGRLYSEYLDSCRKLEELDAQISADAKEREYLEFQYQKLCEARLADGELDSLEQEHKLLANSSQIAESSARAGHLYEDDRDGSVDSRLKEAGSLLTKLSAFIPDFSQLSQRLDSARIELKDIFDELSTVSGSVEYSPQRLESVEQRLALLYDLMRRHSVDDLSQLVAVRDGLSDRLARSVDMQSERSGLAEECVRLEHRCSEFAERLHQARLNNAQALSGILESRIRSLEMPYAAFSIKLVEKTGFGPDGKDDVQFLFNANGGSPVDLSKCASGGELSRIMLCLKTFMAGYCGMPTLIFDEIDTGVSGSIADKMGQMIVAAGKVMQVFAITHLPQVASKGAAHYLVFKEYDGNSSARTRIRQIQGEERVSEIARMLSGAKLTEEALANARVLLEEI